ncbi:hypothetical protein DFH28DRAFT_873394, partial [Melampsora americana]
EDIDESITETISTSTSTYTWDPKTDYARCFLHKISSTVKGGLIELGRTAPSRSQQREALLGVFPISGTLPVIAEEEEEPPKTVLIDVEPEATTQATSEVPEETETDHNSEADDLINQAPEYDEDVEDQVD